MQIRDVLRRRADLSTFVVHLTKDSDRSARDNLLSIIANRRLEARTPMGWAINNKAAACPTPDSQRVVCFSETPLEHIYSLFADIENRNVHMKPYGLALTKKEARDIGVNPVWYVDRTAGASHGWALATALDEAYVAAVATGNFDKQPLAKALPFIDVMGSWPRKKPTTIKEFWWEREWRHLGDLDLLIWSVALWLAPVDEHDAFRAAITASNEALVLEWMEKGWEPPGAPPPITIVDPNWGVEEIIAHLSGRGDQATPVISH